MSKWEGVLAVVFTVLTIVIAVAAIVGGYDEDRFKATIEAAGYTNISIRGRASPLDCGQDDAYRGKFVATNAQGKVVSGTVCCGLLKNCTVRF